MLSESGCPNDSLGIVNLAISRGRSSVIRTMALQSRRGTQSFEDFEHQVSSGPAYVS